MQHEKIERPLWEADRGSDQTRWWRLLLLVGCLALGGQGHAAPRFLVALQDGQRLQGERLSQWHQEGSSPRIDNRALDDWAWILDYQAQGQDLGQGFIELAGGDRVPGIVQGHVERDGREYWIVEPSSALNHPSSSETRVAIDSRFVRRIVWNNRRADNQPRPPGTLLGADGSLIEAEAIRVGTDRFDLLSSEGVRQVPFTEAGVYWGAAQDDWIAYFQTLRESNPQLHDPMLHWQTRDGLHVTAAESTFRAAGSGTALQPDSWIHSVHPAWSAQPLWVRTGRLQLRLRFSPLEVPLVLLTPHVLRGDPPVRNANATGAWLFAGGEGHGWGWGVLAPSALRFRLPAQAAAVKLECGLDYAADTVGLAAARVVVEQDQERQVLYETQVQHGHGDLEAVDSVLPASQGLSGDRYLVLTVSDARQVQRPGAAPLNWGDLWDWIAPTVVLDRQATLQAIAQP